MTTFPTSLQDMDATRGTTGQTLASPNHITHHALEDDTLEAIMTKIGVDNSAVATSLDYLIKQASNPGHTHTVFRTGTDAFAPINVGNSGVNNSVDTQILINRNVTDDTAGNGHAFADSSQVDRTGGIGYNSFNAAINVLAGESYDHFAGFQCAFVSAATLIDDTYGFYHHSTVSAGTITNAHGIYISESTGAGAITNQYGIYIAGLSKGGTLNYAIYTNAGLVRFGDNVSTTGTITAVGGSLTALSTLAVRDTSAAYDVTIAATSSTILTAGRTLTLDLVNAARTLKISGNSTIDQDVSTSGSPNFNLVQYITRINDADTGPTLGFQKKRTTGGNVSDGDSCGTQAFSGWISDGYYQFAQIEGEVDGTPGVGDYPGRIVFLTTTDGAAAPSEKARLDNAGNFNIVGVYKVDGTQVVGNRVVDARCDDTINSGDATTDGVIDALRDAMITHGLIAAA